MLEIVFLCPKSVKEMEKRRPHFCISIFKVVAYASNFEYWKFYLLLFYFICVVPVAYELVAFENM